MMYSSIAIFLASLAIAAASPTLVPRACATAYPNVLYTLNSAQPDAVNYMPFSQEGPFGIPTLSLSRQYGSSSNPHDNVQFIDFVIPQGSYGCELKITDQAKQLYFDFNGDNSISPPALNVKALFPNGQLGDPTWGNVMKANPPVIAVPSWGTLTLARGSAQTSINSMPCPASPNDGETGGHAQFVFEFAQAGPGNTSWNLPQFNGDAIGVQASNGVYMTYNC